MSSHSCAPKLRFVTWTQLWRDLLVRQARLALDGWHREAIRDLAGLAGVPGKVQTAYACIAQFSCLNPATAEEQWKYQGYVHQGGGKRVRSKSQSKGANKSEGKSESKPGCKLEQGQRPSEHGKEKTQEARLRAPSLGAKKTCTGKDSSKG